MTKNELIFRNCAISEEDFKRLVIRFMKRKKNEGMSLEQYCTEFSLSKESPQYQWVVNCFDNCS